MKQESGSSVVGTCELPLAGGGFLAVKVTAYNYKQTESLALVSTDGGVPKNLGDAIYAARMIEPFFNAGIRVRVQPVKGNEDPALLEFPAIVADRLARGTYRPTAPRVIALGLPPSGSDWLDGRIVAPPCLQQRLKGLLAAADLGEVEILLPPLPDLQDWDKLRQALLERHPQANVRQIGSLAILDGHPIPGMVPRQAEVWFPVGGATEEMRSLQVAVRPLVRQEEGEDEINRIRVADLDGPMLRHLRYVLQRSREMDDRLGEWRTYIQFSKKWEDDSAEWVRADRPATGKKTFQGSSVELALILADRIARGREFPAAGKLIATGEVDDSDGSLRATLAVESCERKCKLILQWAETGKLKEGDRVLLPKTWQGKLPQGFLDALRKKRVSCVLIDRIF